MNQVKQKIHNLVQKYEKDRDYYRTTKFNETQVRNEFLDTLFEILGWDIRNTSGKSTNEREVLLEEPLKANAASHSKKPDYTFRLFGERKFFLEAKKPCVRIDEDNEPAKQVRRYGFTAGLKVSVLSNFEDLFIYDTSCPVEDTDNLNKSRIKAYHYTDYEEYAEELLRFLGRDSVYTGQFEEVWQDITLNVEHTTIDKLFLKQINEWRLMLGEQILTAKPDIEIDHLGDVVQSYINKVLFLRVCEDRNIETYQALLNIADHNSHKELVTKFREADNKYNSGLFKELLSDDIINDVSSSFWTIIRQLYFPESPYSFSVLSSDVLGHIYEIFISQKLDVVDDKLVIVAKPENAERDIVTTPNFIVREILRQTAKKILAGKDDKQINELKCADIACGSGAFLLELYQLLCDALVDYYLANDKSKLIQTNINTYKLPFETKRNLLTNCIFGVDKDFNAVEACKFGLLLKLLEDENVNTLSSFHPILPELKNNIFFGNSLLSKGDNAKNVDNYYEDVNPHDFYDLRFDLIVGNPPYMKTKDIKHFTPKEYALYPIKYVSAQGQYDKYFLFVERAYKLLRPKGMLGYIIPNKFVKLKSARGLRKFISENKCLVSFITFGSNQVFSGKSTYTGLLCLEKDKRQTFQYVEVNGIKSILLNGIATLPFYTKRISDFGEGTWNLLSDDLEKIYNTIIANTVKLEDIIVSKNCRVDDYIYNGIQTSKVDIYIFKPDYEDDEYYYFTRQDERHQIEKSITRPYYETERGNDDALNTYRELSSNARVIFPYFENGSQVNLIPRTVLSEKYPKAMEYFLKFETPLKSRNFGKTTNKNIDDEWYKYGRSQNILGCFAPEKIIVGNLSTGDKYAVDKKQIVVSAGGTAGYSLIRLPKTSSYSIYYIQAIVNSIQNEWMSLLIGEIFMSNFVSRGTKVTKKLRIPTIDFTDEKQRTIHDQIVSRQMKLIELGNRLAISKDNKRSLMKLNKEFDDLKEEQQNVINSLFGLNHEEELLIPRIKELYAID